MTSNSICVVTLTCISINVFSAESIETYVALFNISRAPLARRICLRLGSKQGCYNNLPLTMQNTMCFYSVSESRSSYMTVFEPSFLTA